jgi:formamidase
VVLSVVAPGDSVEPAWRRPVPQIPTTARVTPGHNRWHPGIPAVAEIISGGSVRLECQEADVDSDPLLCGPIAVVGAEPGDVIVVDVLGIGRSDGRYAGSAHPGIIGCAPAAGPLDAISVDPDGALLGHVRPGLAAYEPIANQALRSAERGRDIGRCAVARLTAGSRVLLPIQVEGARLSVGDLHFPAMPGGDCAATARAGWIDLRVNLTRRGVERFHVTGPLLMPAQ